VKVAFVFSGLVRDINRTVDYFSEKIKEYDADVFASVWDLESDSDEHDTVDNFIKWFKPKKINIDNWNAYKKSTVDLMMEEINVPLSFKPEIQKDIESGGWIGMWYQIWKSNSLIYTADERYDVVVRLRTDLILDDKFIIEKNEFLNLPIGSTGIGHYPSSRGPTDVLAYGSPEIMNYYSSLYCHLMRYLSEGYLMFPPESTLGVHLSKRMINIHFLNISVKHYKFTRINNKKEIYLNYINKDNIGVSEHRYGNSRLLWGNSCKFLEHFIYYKEKNINDV
jgi:hypothetical protein